MEGGLLSGQIVYAYKYDKSKRSVLVSDTPTLDDDFRKVFGWVPSDLIAAIGQNRSFLLSDGNYTDSIPGLTNTHDTLQIHEASLQSRILFDYAGNARQAGLSDSDHTDINIPILVWNRRWNNLINIKGGNVHSNDIRRMEKKTIW